VRIDGEMQIVGRVVDRRDQRDRDQHELDRQQRSYLEIELQKEQSKESDGNDDHRSPDAASVQVLLLVAVTHSKIVNARPERSAYFGSLEARTSTFSMTGGLASNSPALAIRAAATRPVKWAWRPASLGKVSKIPKVDVPILIAYQVVVAGSCS